MRKKRIRHSEWAVWNGMLQRCRNKNRDDYKYYGAKGISVEWNSFKEFIADMGRRPSPRHTIDRKDGSKNYSKENCIWATRLEQASNLSSNRNITYEGEEFNLSQWSRKLNTPLATLFVRIKKHGEVLGIKMSIKNNVNTTTNAQTI